MMKRHARPWTRWTSAKLAGLFHGPQSTGGATVAEFAIGLPILFGLVFGIMELGRFGFTHAGLYYAAQQTTRWALVNPIDAEGGETQAEYESRLQAAAQQRLTLISNGHAATVVATAPESPLNDKTRDISIAITFRYEPMMPFVPGPIDLSVASMAFIADEDSEGLLTGSGGGEQCQWWQWWCH
jgi:hypothetical protein